MLSGLVRRLRSKKMELALLSAAVIPPLPDKFWTLLQQLIQILIAWFQQVLAAIFG